MGKKTLFIREKTLQHKLHIGDILKIHKNEQENSINTEAFIGGDEYISACALVLAAMAKGQSRLYNVSRSQAFANLCRYLMHAGIHMEQQEGILTVQGNGLQAFRTAVLKNNTETVYDLFSVLAYKEQVQDFEQEALTVFIKQASAKTKKTVAAAKTKHKKEFQCNLARKDFVSRSAREYFYLKAALLFAALLENQKAVITEVVPFCDHLERLFAYFGIKLESWGKQENRITFLPVLQAFPARDVPIPNALITVTLPILQTVFSTADSFFAESVLLNPKRSGFLYALKAMGADITLSNRSWFAFEPVADITVKGGKGLRGVVVPEAVSASLFEETPFLLAAAAYAAGKTTCYGMGNTARTEQMRSLANNCFALPAAVHAPAEGVLEVIGVDDMAMAEKYWQSLREGK